MKSSLIIALSLITFSALSSNAAVIATQNECKQLEQYAQRQRITLGSPQGSTMKEYQKALYNFYVSKSWLQRIEATTPALQNELVKFGQMFDVAMNITAPKNRFDILMSLQNASVRTLNLAMDSILTNYCTTNKTFLSTSR